MMNSHVRRRIAALAAGLGVAVASLTGCSVIDDITGSGGTPTCAEYTDMSLADRSDALDEALADHGHDDVDNVMVMFAVESFCAREGTADSPIDEGVRWDRLGGRSG